MDLYGYKDDASPSEDFTNLLLTNALVTPGFVATYLRRPLTAAGLNEQDGCSKKTFRSTDKAGVDNMKGVPGLKMP